MAQTFDIPVTTYAYGGEVLGRLPDGRAAFVPYALPGEEVRIRLVEEKRGYARAELVEVLVPSPVRITPRCPHFTACGGCHYQHMAYPDQLTAKSAILVDQLERIGRLVDIPIQPMVASPQAWNYRNHVQFHLAAGGKLGFQAARSNQVVGISECHLPETLLNTIWPQLDIEPTPGLERVSLRLGADEEVMLILESSDPQPMDFSVEELPISAIHLGPGGALVLAGSEYIVIEVLGRPFRVSVGAFFQVNTALAGGMVEHLLADLPLTPDTTVLEVYCGVGLFSAFLAGRVARLIGVELDPAACEDFVVNLDEFENVELYEAAAEQVLPSQVLRPEVIVVDPPRAGLGRVVLDGILAQGAPYLAYVSCDPATLARDARRLVEGGYKLTQITPFDLFPQTYHIESISLWGR